MGVRPEPGRRARAWRLLALLLTLGVIATACGGGDDDAAEQEGGEEAAISSTVPESDTEEVQTGGTVIVGLEAETNNWLPGITRGNNSSPHITSSLYDSIAAYSSDGNVYPFLAQSIEPNEDLTEWTVTLRPDITMHDGTELNAELMKTIFDEYLTIEGASTAGGLANVLEVRVDDELTYTYVLEDTMASFPDVLTGAAGMPFSVEACEANGGRDGGCGDHPVGAGAFQLVSWTRDDQLVLERNPNYWRTDANGVQLPYLDELIFRPIPDEDSRLQSVISGTIHVGQTLRQSVFRQAREAEEIISYESIGNNGGGSLINTTRPPLDDVRVRLGVLHALNQDDLIEVLGGTGITPRQTQYFSPDSPWFSQAVEDAFPMYDPEKAAEYLNEYINDPNRSDGKAVGEPIAFEYSCPSDPSLREIAQAYQAMLTDAGIEITLTSFEQAIHITNAIDPDGDPPFAGNYYMQCWRMGSEGDPYNTLLTSFGDPAVQALNVTNYTSDELQANLEILRSSADFDERYAAVEAIMMELATNAVLMWTGGTATSVYARPEVRNIAGWTIPDAEGMPTIPGTGVRSASTHWSEVWLARD